jgi:hypothetical protein
MIVVWRSNLVCIPGWLVAAAWRLSVFTTSPMNTSPWRSSLINSNNHPDTLPGFGRLTLYCLEESVVEFINNGVLNDFKSLLKSGEPDLY